MTYRQIIKEIYSNHKFFIRIYLALALCASVFLFYTEGTPFVPNAATLSNTEITILGGSFTTAFLLFASNANISITPPVALSISAILSIWQEYGTLPEQLQNYSFGLMDIWSVRIFVFVWALLSILPRCTQITRIGGLVLEDVDQKMGQIATIVIPFSQILANFSGDTVSYAADSYITATVQRGSAILNTCLCFLFLTGLLACFLLIRTFLFFIDIILLPLCTLFPLTSSISELLKIAGVILMSALAVFAPGAYIICYGILLLFSVFLFKKAYISVRYFKQIYVRPFFKKIRGYESNIPLLCPHAPKRILAEISDTDLKLLIPVYSLQRTALSPLIQKHDKWWLAVSPNGCYLYKYYLLKKQLQKITLTPETANKIFIRNSLRFFELFSLKDETNIGKSFRRLKKNWHFAYSNEYYHRFNDILQITGFTDYNQCVTEKKHEFDASRKNKKRKI